MKLLALTGGVGSGKSTVATALAGKGAVIVDADAIVKQLQEPGRPVFEAMVERWGLTIVTPDGVLDRKAVAEIVFNDKVELAALNSIVHPKVSQETDKAIRELSETDKIVIMDIPLLTERLKTASDRSIAVEQVSHVIVVDCPVETAIERLVEFRNFTPADAKARVAAQVSRSERLEIADFVIDNGGDLQELEDQIKDCWAWIAGLPHVDLGHGSGSPSA